MEICKKLLFVKADVKQFLLKKYVQACRWVYAIGFFQWRLNNDTPDHQIPNYDKEEDLLELIEKYNDIKHKRAQETVAKPIQNPNLQITDKNCLKKYELFEEEPKDFLINSFQRIGWQDPFPDEVQMMDND